MGAPKDGLLCRTAQVIYMAEHDGQANVTPYDHLHPSRQAKYERMAAAALREAYLEPATV